MLSNTKNVLSLFALACFGIIVGDGLGIFFLLASLNDWFGPTPLWAIILIGSLLSLIASASSPLAILANRAYDQLLDRLEYVLWGFGYFVTLLPHQLYIMAYFGFGMHLSLNPFTLILAIVSISALLFPLIYWPIAIHQRKLKRLRRPIE